MLISSDIVESGVTGGVGGKRRDNEIEIGFIAAIWVESSRVGTDMI